MFLKKFKKVKLIKALAGFELLTYRFVANALTNCATLLGNNFGKDFFFLIKLDFFLIVKKCC